MSASASVAASASPASVVFDVLRHLHRNPAALGDPASLTRNDAGAVSRKCWSALAADVVAREQTATMAVLAAQYYTLRLDVRGMSKLRRRLVDAGAMPIGFCDWFAQLMRDVAADLAGMFAAKWAYTQGDEITLLVAPIVARHQYNGARDKLVSLAAGRASALASSIIQERVGGRVLLEFDARLAVWDTERDAFGTILWRAYDCGVCSVTNAVFARNGRKGGIVHEHTHAKLEWLATQGALPLPVEQRHGSLFVRRRRQHDDARAVLEPVVLPAGLVSRVLELDGELPDAPLLLPPSQAQAPLPQHAAVVIDSLL